MKSERLVRKPEEGASGPVRGETMASADNTIPALPASAIPHHHACIRRRPPRWVRKAPRRDAGLGDERRSIAEGWRDPRVRTAPGGGPVRTNFTYRNSFVSSAVFSPTIRRDVYAEGPFESIYHAILATDAATAEFVFQVAEITWTRDEGQPRSYTLDGGRVTEDGREVWFEEKADRTYFEDRDIADQLELVERLLAERDISLDRIVGAELLEPVRLQVVGEVLRHRAVPFERSQSERARDIVLEHGGLAPLGLVREALSPNRLRADALASSMLLRRVIGFPVDLPLTGDTPVRIPHRPARRLSRFEG